MKTYKAVEKEINQIRLKIYDETKDMTPEQYTERVRKIGEEAAKIYGFQRVSKAEISKNVHQDSNHAAPMK